MFVYFYPILDDLHHRRRYEPSLVISTAFNRGVRQLGRVYSPRKRCCAAQPNIPSETFSAICSTTDTHLTGSPSGERPTARRVDGLHSVRSLSPTHTPEKAAYNNNGVTTVSVLTFNNTSCPASCDIRYILLEGLTGCHGSRAATHHGSGQNIAASAEPWHTCDRSVTATSAGHQSSVGWGLPVLPAVHSAAVAAPTPHAMARLTPAPGPAQRRKLTRSANHPTSETAPHPRSVGQHACQLECA